MRASTRVRSVLTVLLLGRCGRRCAGPLHAVVACCLLLFGTTAMGSPISSFVLGLEARATNNALLAPTDERDDTIFLPEARIGLQDRRERLQLDADYRYRARRYRRDSFPDDQILTGSGTLALDVVPTRYRVTLGHDRQQNLEDPQLAGTPFNQVETDALSLTQELSILSSPVNTLTATGVFTMVSGALPADESDRVTVSLDFSRRIDDRSTLGVAVEFLDVDFDLGLLPDFDRRSIFARAGRSGRSWSLDLGVGRNELRREGFDPSGGLATDFEFEWRPTARTTARFTAVRQFTDLRAEGGLVGLDPDALLTPAEFDGLVFEETSLDFGLTFATERVELFSVLGAGRQDFEDSDDELRTTSASIGLSYNLGRALSLDGAFRWSSIEFDRDLGPGASAREDEQRQIEIGLAWEPGPRTQIGLSLLDDRRDSSDPGPEPGVGAGGFFIFDERALVLKLSRSFL